MTDGWRPPPMHIPSIPLDYEPETPRTPTGTCYRCASPKGVWRHQAQLKVCQVCWDAPRTGTLS